MSNFLFPSIRPCGKLARPSSTLLASLLAISMATGLPAAEKQAANPSQKGQLKIVFTGDVMLDDGPGHALSINEDIFSDVASLLTPANISVCNLECVVAGHGHGTHQLKPYTFKARPETIPVLKKYFSAVSVANNHSGDYGPDGPGGRDGPADGRRPPLFWRRQEPGRGPSALILTRQGRRVALLGYDGYPPRSFEAGKDRCGVAWLNENEVLADIKTAREVDHAEIVIPMLHWGHELYEAPEKWQKALARKMIDAGADAVIGAHPHVIQTFDVYRGKPIIYSLGNFVFDYYPGDPPVWNGWVAELTFPPSGPPDVDLHVVEMDRSGVPHVKDGVEK